MARYVLGYLVEEAEDYEERQEARAERDWTRGWESVPCGGFEALQAAKEEKGRQR